MKRAAVIFALALVLAGCGQHSSPSSSKAPRRTSKQAVPAAAEAAAREYLYAARSSTASTAVSRFEQRRDLSVGKLHHDIVETGAPTPAQVAAQRASMSGSDVDVLSRKSTRKGSAVTVRFQVRERTWESRRVAESGAEYRVDLIRVAGGAWRVRAFTVEL